MDIRDKVVVVTGGANGIGRALCRRFAQEGARAVVVADVDAAGAQRVADEIHGISVGVDVADEMQVRALVDRSLEECGAIDLFCSNAGVAARGGPEAPDADWQRLWEVNVLAHVYVARTLIPYFLEQGAGYLLGTVSAAGLLNHVDAAPYGVTKAAALSLFEWLSIAHGDAGVRVSALCPQGVRTSMLEADGRTRALLLAGAIQPEDVADAVVAGVAAEQFLILPHPEVHDYFLRKASDYDRWLRGMRRLRTQLLDLNRT